MLAQGNIKTFDDTKKDITEELYTQGEIYPVGFPEASVMTFLKLPMWTQPWNKPKRIKEILKGGGLSRFKVPKETFRESGKARNISRLQILSPDSEQETAIEESGTLDFPQLPVNFPELAGLGQTRYIPEHIPIKPRPILPILLPPIPGRHIPGYRYIPEHMPVIAPSGKRIIPRRILPRRSIIPGSKIHTVEMAGFDQTPEGTPHLIYQGIVDRLQTPTGTARDSESGFLENTITKIGDWWTALETTKYQAQIANAQTQVATAQSKVAQANIMSILPWGILAVGIVYLLKKRGK
jgi:hypothetical protein